MNPQTTTLSSARDAVRLDALGETGANLARPECVLATRSGHLYTADWRGGVARTSPDGRQTLFTGTMPDGLVARPNGIALLRDGSFLLAQLGDKDGGVYRLTREGQIAPWLRRVDGVDMPPTNFVVQDAAGRTWITVSTTCSPRSEAYRADVADGFIVCVQPDGHAAIVADGLGYTNEVALHPDGQWLYVNETFARRLSRFRVDAHGALSDRQTVAEFGPGTFPDGLAFDEEGGAWVVSIVSNRLIRVAPDGKQQVWLEDADPAHLAWVEAAYLDGSMGRPHLDGIRSQRLRNISSIAFAGPDRRTGVLGCLLGDRLVSLSMPVPGVAPFHWNFP
ncbi:MAG: SMP-30/gluconolactonase/LRE family protein [Hydrogenophaga sp.]|uniref:SMP-30/gluconolactonase/LRE family protein n=1 Tax=Hydrogenophaga sp. TaxID=1904254 RepID=UPI002629FD9C|nr:SMP-30/gluconolactonase/LRE family protein [Hydrogenophaga sp.]MCV0440561.1 SMP-30/gluconolactonase/LRE family protein [Hydrogenophaga sp.]